MNVIELIFKTRRMFYKKVVLEVYKSHAELKDFYICSKNKDLLYCIEDGGDWTVTYPNINIKQSDYINYFKMSAEEVNNIENEQKRKLVMECRQRVYELCEEEANSIVNFIFECSLIMVGVMIAKILNA